MGTKLERKLAKVFAQNANGSYVTAFKTTEDETPTYSKDVEVIQNNNYENGWVNGLGNDEVYGEDLNGVNYTQSYLTKYLYQMGVPEWKVDEEYFENSYCQVNGDLYKSLSDNNIGNNPTIDDVNWVYVDITPVTASNLGTATGVFKQKNVSDLEFKSIAVSGNGSITADENTITIDIGGGETGTVYWENLPKNSITPTTIGQELSTKQNLIGYTPENVSNKVTSIRASEVATNTAYPTELATRTELDKKQDVITGFANSFDNNDDIASFYPTATTSNIGTTINPVTNVNATTITTTGNATIGGTLNTGYIKPTSDTTYDIGDSNNNYKHGYIESTHTKYLYGTGGTSTNHIVYIGGNTTITPVNSTDNFKLGKNTTYFTELYSTDVYTQYLTAKSTSDGGNDNIELHGGIVPATDNTYDLGSSTSAIKTIYANQLRLTTTDEQSANRLDIRARTKISNSTSGFDISYTAIVPLQNETNNLGSTDIKFRNLYVLNINGSPYSPSDRNKKENIVERGTRKGGGSSLKSINDIKTYNYNYKSEADKSTHIGIMAQELREVEPSLVVNRAEEGSKQEDLYVDVMGYITLLTESIKELNSKVESLEARIEVLEKGEAKK